MYLFERLQGGSWQQRVTLRPAGWENPPGPPSTYPFGPIEELSEAEQRAFFASFIFPGHIFSDSPEVSFFGATVDLDKNRLAVTAGFANATYVFERRGEAWDYQFRITARDQKTEPWEDWAQVVSLSGDTVLLGTPSDFGNSAHVFSLATEVTDG